MLGDPTGIRTPDPLLKRQLLCRLSYRVKSMMSAAAAARLNWLGRLDSNQRVRESKSLALPLGDAPMWKEIRDRDYPDPLLLSGVGDGTRTHNARNHNPVLCQLNYTHHIYGRDLLKHPRRELARQKGLEPLAHCLEGSCSIQLSYWRISWSR